MVEMGVVLITSLCIAFYYSWRITLICLAYLPVLVVAGAFAVCLKMQLFDPSCYYLLFTLNAFNCGYSCRHGMWR